MHFTRADDYFAAFARLNLFQREGGITLVVPELLNEFSGF